MHIIWNEHHREYKRHTIGGDFGNVQIIITPYTSSDDCRPFHDRLYVINIQRDPKIPLFGPLVNNMILPGYWLGRLVRCTAMNAYRYVLQGDNLCNSKGYLYRHVYSDRKQDISIIASRHRIDASREKTAIGVRSLVAAPASEVADYEAFLQGLFQTSQDTIPQLGRTATWFFLINTA